MLKITVINGQNHKGSTYNIGKILVDSIPCEKEVKEFFLPKDLNHFCTGCYACVEDETKCPYYEEKRIIMQKIEEADLLVFTTPNYCMAPSASMKAFIDLTFTYWFSHKPRACMFDKKGVVISTTAGIGANKAIEPVARTLFYWGIPWIKKYGIGVQAMNWDGASQEKKIKVKRDMEKLAKRICRSKSPTVPLKTKFIFNIMAKMQKANFGSSPTEKKYWQERGWLGKERPWKQN